MTVCVTKRGPITCDHINTYSVFVELDEAAHGSVCVCVIDERVCG